MSRYYPPNLNVEKECCVCGKIFTGKKNSIYCSKECYLNMTAVNKEYLKHSNARKKKYARLVNYVQKNNLKEILKKYLPGKVA